VLRAAAGAFVAAACVPAAGVPSPTGSAASSAGRPASPLAANAALGIWPDQITTASREIREAYAYAARAPRSLLNIPCYCGCGAAGHRNNQDCYVKTFASDGWVVLDLHGYG
jgi:uncharacterized protein with PCYCGC motif